jgi:hypothetical protein
VEESSLVPRRNVIGVLEGVHVINDISTRYDSYWHICVSKNENLKIKLKGE